MTQEHKELLIKDICERLPYGVKIEVTYSKDSGSSLRDRLCCEGINTLDTNILWLFQQSEIYIKPYLFPLSSMTEEKEEEFKNLYYRYHESAFIFNERFSYDRCSIKDIGFYPYYLQDWLNKNHFDYRNLIEKGLAVDATGKSIY